ncbi:DUF697 domain-containing protein [Rhodoflexus caldus]|uniref:DUF697 domain-containing protein n=1 Tax=Rhodoflexus caldus TaxID=2891236 RepID=UPI00202AB2CC|nr:DUF697 domain-containing protein [Rhodoflexus caldus]
MIDYFLNKIKETMGSRKDKSEAVIKSSVMWSMGAGLIPIPVADMVAVTAIQMDMLKQLCVIYEINFSESQFKTLLATLTGSALSRMGAEAIKVIPGLGSVIGGVSMAAISGATTYAVGQVFMTHFENGGNMQNFDVEAFKDFYKKQFERGKAFVEELRKEKTTAEANKATGSEQPPKSAGGTSTNDALAKLRELSELLDKGLITPEEFKLLKENLLKTI